MKIKHLFLVACAALWGVSCSHSEIEESYFAPNTATHTLSVEGTLADFDVEETRVAGVSVIRLEWSAGDKVSVINLTTGKALGGDLTADESGSVTTFSGTVTGTINSGDKLALLSPCQNYTEEQDYTPATIDFSKQSGNSNVPLCVYATFDYSGNISGIKAKFDYLMAYVRMNLAALTQDVNLQKVAITNVSKSMNLDLSAGKLVPTAQAGLIVLSPEKTTGSNHAQTVFFTTPASSTELMRKVYIQQDDAWKVSNWTMATLRAAGLYNTVVGDFVETEDGPIVDPDAPIVFADARVKAICVANWDTNGDGELSYAEATAVTNETFKGGETYSPFYNKSTITSFDEFQYFTGVTEIGTNAFGGCSSLTSVMIPDSVTEIGSYAFYNCSSLTSVTIPDSVTTIGGAAFAGCSSLTSVTIPASVTSIGGSAFSGCSSLTSVTIPDSVTRIGNYAFDSCSSLTSVTIPDSVTTIGNGAFYNCSGLTSVTIPDSVTTIGGYAFYGCTSLTSVVIPDSVTTIGESAFQKCSSLTSVVIGDSVTTIGDYAFYRCGSLTSIVIPDSVTEIGGYAFADCSSLTSPLYNAHIFCYLPTSYAGEYTIPTGITTIAGGAFYDCSNLTSVTIPDSVIEIGYSTFSGCSNLTAFYGKFASEDHRCLIVTGVLKAFAPAGLTEYTIPDSVTEIGENAFSCCSSLTSITIPNSVNEIGNEAFTGCSGTLTVNCNIPSATLPKNGAFYHSSFTSVVIGEGVQTIGDLAFNSCYILTSVVIPDSVTEIGNGAFSGCSGLTNAVIGNSVTTIGYSTFYCCYNLTSVYCKPATPPSGRGGMFSANASGRKIYVPTGSVDAYKAATYWSDYADYIVGYNF